LSHPPPTAVSKFTLIVAAIAIWSVHASKKYEDFDPAHDFVAAWDIIGVLSLPSREITMPKPASLHQESNFTRSSERFIPAYCNIGE